MFGGAALLGAGITAFYMSRLIFMTFFGAQALARRGAPARVAAADDLPDDRARRRLGLLGAFLVIGGRFTSWLEPVTGGGEEHHPVIPKYPLMALTLALVALGVFLAWRQYWQAEVPQTAPRGSVLTRAARRDLYQDDVNEAVFMRPGQYLTRFLVFADTRGVDGAVNGLAAGIGGLAGRLRRWQTGFVRSYALSMLAGVVVLVLGVLAVRI